MVGALRMADAHAPECGWIVGGTPAECHAPSVPWPAQLQEHPPFLGYSRDPGFLVNCAWTFLLRNVRLLRLLGPRQTEKANTILFAFPFVSAFTIVVQ